jgi:protein-tyrosine phosphatase
MTIKVLFVCTANVCRSPTAEGVFRTLAERAGLGDAFSVASAGTSNVRAGQAPTPLAVEVAARRGYDISRQVSHAVTKEDIAAADYVLAMDRGHLADLRWMAPRDRLDRLQLFTRFGPMPTITDVQDPFGGTPQDYERTLDLIEAGCKGLLKALTPEAQNAAKA